MVLLGWIFAVEAKGKNCCVMNQLQYQQTDLGFKSGGCGGGGVLLMIIYNSNI